MRFKGTNFKPINLIKALKWNFALSHEKREKDPSSNALYEKGSGIINHPSNLGLKGKYLRLEKLLYILHKHKSLLLKYNITEIKITLVHTFKNNLSSLFLDPKVINLLNSLEIGIYIDFLWYLKILKLIF